MSLLLGVFAGAAFIEGAARILDPGGAAMRSKRLLTSEQIPRTVFHCYPSNPNGEFEPVPDVSHGGWRLRSYEETPRDIPLERLHETPWCVEIAYTLKNYYGGAGIRDREFSDLPGPGITRIAGMGDSFMVGEGVPLELALPRQVERLLGEGYEVLNCGEMGDNTLEELQALREVVATAHCRRAIFQFLPNDARQAPELAQRQSRIVDLVKERSGRRLRILDFVAAPFELRWIERETMQLYLDSFDPQYNLENIRDLDIAFRELANFPGCQVVLVIYPILTGFEEGYPLATIHERVAGMAREAGLPVLDLAPFFEGMDTKSLWAHESDHHPNGKAHGIAARAIVEWLRSEVPGFLEPDAPSAP